MAKNSKYEYGTSPRKISPYYSEEKPIKKKKPTKQEIKQKQLIEKKKKYLKMKEEKKKARVLLKRRLQVIGIIFCGFAMLFTISYRNSKIDEEFAEMQRLQKDLALIRKENEQMELKTNNSLSLKNIEQDAREKLGMQKPKSSQMVYVNLPKVNYIETTTTEDNAKNPIFEWIERIF